MACGTPVLAFHCGSVPEIIDPGVTGLIVDTVEEAVRVLPQVVALDRHAVRRRFEERFTASRMAKNYVHVYHALLKQDSLSERDTTMPLRQPVMEKEMN
jgi:glycosyltransferase involved in cell wall biosynthesis